MHHSKLIRLCIALHELRDVLVHVETSGTIFHELSECYVTVSPKISCLERMVHRADELKFLVDENFDEANLTPAMLKHRKVFVQPVNGILKIDEQNLNRCKELVVKHPTWRVSFQAHKFYNWR
jgi:organic radical activating enzyme